VETGRCMFLSNDMEADIPNRSVLESNLCYVFSVL
jgi:hypothetical protein